MSSTPNANVQSFGMRSSGYARHRPTYPAELFDWILSNCPNRQRAWDCATGNGQAAISLAKHFAQVDATDLSAEQVAEGFRAENLTYKAAPAENSGFDDNSFDLITVAQAVHWFDYELFWPEVRRVARNGAFFCAWGYGFIEGDQVINAAVIDPALEMFDLFWARGNRIIMAGYQTADINFPFERLDAPELAIEVEWTVEDLVNFFHTWSAYKLMQEQNLGAEVDSLFEGAKAGLADQTFALRMPISIAAGHID